MKDFSANVKAILDTKDVYQKLSDVGKSEVKLSNITLNKDSLISQIQSALNGHKFTLTFDNVNTSGLNRQMQQTGANIGRQISNAVSSSLNNIHLKNGSIGNIRNMLQGAGFDTKSINAATQDLDRMVLTINKLSTSQLNNGNIRMTISGVDELNRAVQIVREFDREPVR